MISDVRRNWNRKSAGQKGFALWITAAALFFLLPVVGLAIDVSMLYAVKARLQTSTDAAAIAAARTLSVGLTMAEQEQSAINQATSFFHANMPENWASTYDMSVTPTVAETAFRTRTVTVTANVRAPLFFMRTLWSARLNASDRAGDNALPGEDADPNPLISAMGKASRRDVNLVLVLDRSGSMDRVPTGSSVSACDAMKNAADYFVGQFAESRDRLAMVTFNTAAYVAFAPSMYFKTGYNSLPNRINEIDCTGGTGTAGALNQGYQLIQQTNEPGALNLIVLFTDGIPNGVAARFPVKKQYDTRYGYGYDNYTYTSSQYNMAPSTCKDYAGRTYPNTSWAPGDSNGNLFGVLAMASSTSSSENLTGTGYTWALYKSQTTSGTSGGEIVDSSTAGATISSCRFTSQMYYARRDLAYIPSYDVYGNRLDGPYRQPINTSNIKYTFTSGPYSGRMRPDNRWAVVLASTNGVDNQATTIRSDNSLKPIIYCIGLAGNSDNEAEDPDWTLLKRVSNVNDPANTIYDPSLPSGLEVEAPSLGELNMAFARVASEILRLAQ